MWSWFIGCCLLSHYFYLLVCKCHFYDLVCFSGLEEAPPTSGRAQRAGRPGHSARALQNREAGSLTKLHRCSICKLKVTFFPSTTFVNRETVCHLKISKCCEISKNNLQNINFIFDHVSQDIANKNWRHRDLICFIWIHTERQKMRFQLLHNISQNSRRNVSNS